MTSSVMEVDGDDQTLLIQSNKGTIYESRLQDLNLSERTSNGSFISDTTSDEEVLMPIFRKFIKNLNLRDDKNNEKFSLKKKPVIDLRVESDYIYKTKGVDSQPIGIRPGRFLLFLVV